MDGAAYIAGYERFAARLPALLSGWEELSPTRQDAYADELFRFIVRRSEALRVVSDAATFARITAADDVVRHWSAEIEAAMGFQPGLTLARRRDAQRARYTVTFATEPLAAAG